MNSDTLRTMIATYAGICNGKVEYYRQTRRMILAKTSERTSLSVSFFHIHWKIEKSGYPSGTLQRRKIYPRYRHTQMVTRDLYFY